MKKNENKTGRFDFLGKGVFFGVVSAIAVLGSIFLILFKGLIYGIDFAGGIEVQIQFAEQVNIEQLRQYVDSLKLGQIDFQSFGDGNEYLLRLESPKNVSSKEINLSMNSTITKLTDGLKTQFPTVVIRRVDSVGPQVGSELKRDGILATFYSLIIILIYVGLRFDYQYAPGAVICLFHDAIITLGVMCLLGKQVSVQTMAAIMTIIGYSLNDTIINFDRIRENLTFRRNYSLYEIVNLSVNEMLSRTLLTSFTVLLALFALYFWGGGVIRELAFSLGVGVIVGVYSSIYVSNALLIVFDKWMKPHRT